MPHAGTIIDNMATHGHKVEFVQVPPDDQRETAPVKVILSVMPGAWQSDLHVHPVQVERITMLDGEIIVEVDGIPQPLTPASGTATVPPSIPHRFWITAGNPARFELEMNPALDFADFLTTLLGRAQGDPNLLQLSVMLAAYRRENQLPHTLAGRLLNGALIALSPMAYLLGYRP